MSKVIRNISLNVFVFGGVNAIKSLIPLIMLPILTLYLSTDEFGLLSIIETIVSFLVPFITIGVTSAIGVNFHKMSLNDFGKFAFNSVFISFVVFTLIFLLSLFFFKNISLFFGVPVLYVYALSVFAFIRVLSNIVLTVLQTSLNVKLYLYISIIQIVCDFTLSYIFVAYICNGIVGRFFGIYFSFFISSMIGGVALFRLGLIKAGFGYSREILRYGSPLIFHSIGGAIIAMSDRLFISKFYGPTDVGMYVVAYQMAATLLLVGVSINQAWAPIYFGLMKSKDYKKINRFSMLLVLVILLSALFAYLFRGVLFEIFVDKKFWGGLNYFPYLLIGFLFQSIYFVFANFFFFEGKTSFIATVTLLGGGVNLILNFLLMKVYGVIGLAYATAITWGGFFFVVFICQFFLLKKKESDYV